MSAHNHPEFVDGCFRCELSKDEVTNYTLKERLSDDLEALIQEAQDEPQFTPREHALMGAGEIEREIVRPAMADAWGEAIELAASTLRDHQNGDQFGAPVTIKDMAHYIPTAINPYRDGDT